MSSDTCADQDGPFVDLHTHSTASDGAVAPAEVVRSAAAIGLAAIALTDHDTVDGVAEASAEGEKQGVRVIAGCELSAFEKNLEIHLLVLHIRSPETLKPHLDQFRDERFYRARQMVEKLNAAGHKLSFDDVLVEADGGVIGRPHVARAMLNKGLVTDFREAFERYLGFGCPAYVEKPRISSKDAIAIAHAAGGMVFWAHPSKDGGRERTKRLVDEGLDGLEVIHPSHTSEDIKRFHKFVTEFNLVKTGGSDWHGAREGYRTLGNMNIPMSWLAAQDQFMAAQATL